MIVCKPKSSAIFSLSVFLLLCYSLFVILLSVYINANKSSFFSYILMLISGSLAVAITFRMLMNYKVLRVSGKGKINLQQKFLLRNVDLDIKDLSQVQEESIKTYNGIYKKLTLQFGKKIIKISNQEYSDYDKFKAYLDSHKPKKQTK